MNNFTILLTDKAIDHLKKVLKEGEALHLGLKVSGCNGFGYTMDVKPTDKNNEVIVKGIKIVVLPEHRESLTSLQLIIKEKG